MAMSKRNTISGLPGKAISCTSGIPRKSNVGGILGKAMLVEYQEKQY